jgi:3-hydroxyisobutyrate dehydrogenase-like beta-hydroxyacid dehydrogenase
VTKRIGFIGLGNMGKPISKNLLKAGYPVVVFDIREELARELETLGARTAQSPKEVAKASDVIFTMVLDDMQTERVILGEEGVFGALRKDSTIIITSTISPSLCKRIADQAGEKEVGVLDAAVSGGPMGAEAGTLTIMVGGNKNLFERCRPILEVLGKNIFYFGSAGMGQVAKAVNNALLHYNTFGAVEAFNLAIKAGIELERMLELARSSSGKSWPIEHWDFYSSMKKKGPPALDIPYKDLKIAIDMGREIGQDMPLASFCLELDLYKLPELPD